MKNLILIFLIPSMMLSISTFGQEEESKSDQMEISTKIDSTQTIYCLIVGSKVFNKLTVTIDMGEEKGFLGFNTSYIIDEKSGKSKNFNSMVDALNFMGRKGWEFVQAYTITVGSTNVYHYLLNQKIKVGQDGKYYPATKKAFVNDDK